VFRPAADGRQGMLERPPFLRQFVFDTHGRLGYDDSRHDSLGLQLAEPLRQHPIADVGNRGAKLGKAHPPVQQQMDDGAGPPAADELHRAMEAGAELGFEAHGLHFTRLASLDTINLLLYSDRVLVSTKEDAMSTTTATAATPTRTAWKIDPAHSQIEFSVRHMMITTVKGRFSGVDGTVSIDEADPSNADVDVRIDASTIDTRESQRDAHLRSADFFDVEKFPHITFKSRRIVDRDGSEFKLAGDLTLRGVTKEVVLDVTEEGRGKDPWGGDRLGFTATTKVKRGDFGLNWNQALETGGFLVSDEIKINLDLQLVKA
jgi:polyisoprenoid-binding protein YceI